MTLVSERRAAFAARASRALHYLPLTALAIDSTVVVAVCLVAVWGRRRLGVFDAPADLTSSLDMIGPLILLGWVAAVAVFGGYRLDVFGVGTDEYKRVLNASLVSTGALGVACYLAKFQLSRGFFLLLFVAGVPALLAGRLLLRRAVQGARRQGRLGLRVLIAGSPGHVDEVASVLRRESWLGYHVEGALVPDPQERTETDAGIPIVGGTQAVTDEVRRAGVDVIFFAGGALTSAEQLRRIAWDLELDAVQVVVAPSVTDVSGERVRVRPVGGVPLMHIDPPRSTDASSWGKRIFDVAGSIALLVAFSPVFLVAALQVKLHDGGPILFRQVRTGRNGVPFSCLKLRTMVLDAEERLAELHAAQGHQSGLFKMRDDPRVTKPGRWLRRYSLDELPQLVNVLRGEMSLVGPRPPLPREVATYERDVLRRLRVRPGMTGLWQVSGRSDLAWADAVRLDLYYVDNWSMLQDLYILGKTLGAVFGTRGAY